MKNLKDIYLFNMSFKSDWSLKLEYFL